MNKTKVRLELQIYNMDKLIRLVDQEGFISFALRPSFMKNLKSAIGDKKSKIFRASGKDLLERNQE